MNNLLPDIYSKTTDIPIINEADYIAEMFNDMLGNLIEEIFPNMTALSA